MRVPSERGGNYKPAVLTLKKDCSFVVDGTIFEAEDKTGDEPITLNDLDEVPAAIAAPSMTRPQDAARVNVNDAWELDYWSKKFGVTANRLRAAVTKVGTSARALEDELKRR